MSGTAFHPRYQHGGSESGGGFARPPSLLTNPERAQELSRQAIGIINQLLSGHQARIKEKIESLEKSEAHLKSGIQERPDVVTTEDLGNLARIRKNNLEINRQLSVVTLPMYWLKGYRHFVGKDREDEKGRADLRMLFGRAFERAGHLPRLEEWPSKMEELGKILRELAAYPETQQEVAEALLRLKNVMRQESLFVFRTLELHALFSSLGEPAEHYLKKLLEVDLDRQRRAETKKMLASLGN